MKQGSSFRCAEGHRTKEQIERIEPTKYPSVADYTLKNNILSWDHINMWKKAFDQKCNGALLFKDSESDTILECNRCGKTSSEVHQFYSF